MSYVYKSYAIMYDNPRHTANAVLPLYCIFRFGRSTLWRRYAIRTLYSFIIFFSLFIYEPGPILMRIPQTSAYYDNVYKYIILYLRDFRRSPAYTFALCTHCQSLRPGEWRGKSGRRRRRAVTDYILKTLSYIINTNLAPSRDYCRSVCSPPIVSAL